MSTRSYLLIIISILVILGLAGCSSVGAQQASSTPAPVTVAPPISTSAAPPVNFNVSNQTGIWVSGQGVVMVSPNIANLNIGVSAQAAKVADAQSQAATALSKVLSALTANGVDQKDISTRFFSISPITRYDNVTQQSAITGYQVSNTVNVIVRTIDKVGTIIDAAAAAAGDLIRINGIDFSVDDPTPFNSQARTLAMNDAKTKAAQLASLAGVTLGKPFYIAENAASSPVPYATAAPVAANAGVTTPISPGQVSITINVQVAYSIQ